MTGGRRLDPARSGVVCEVPYLLYKAYRDVLEELGEVGPPLDDLL